VTSRSPAFAAAERARKKFRPVSVPQRETLERLSKRAGIELPEVRTKRQASDALTRLEDFLTPSTQQQLEGFNEESGSEVERDSVVA
jgi:hypothetical protein